MAGVNEIIAGQPSSDVDDDREKSEETDHIETNASQAEECLVRGVRLFRKKVPLNEKCFIDVVWQEGKEEMSKMDLCSTQLQSWEWRRKHVELQDEFFAIVRNILDAEDVEGELCIAEASAVSEAMNFHKEFDELCCDF